MKNFIQHGDTITAIAPYNVASGAPFKVGALVLVAITAAAQGATVEGMTEGVFTLPKAAGQAWSMGDKIYWDDTARTMTTAAASGANPLVGAALEAAASAYTQGKVLLDGCIR